MKEDKKMPSKAELKAKVADAKKEAAKLKKPEDIKKFMDANKAKIEGISKKLDGKAREGFNKIVDVVNAYGNKLDEASEMGIQVVSGLVAFIMWMLNMPSAWVVAAASPIIGSIVTKFLGKVLDEADASNVTFTEIKAAYNSLVQLVASARDAKENGTLQDEVLSDIDLNEVLSELQDLDDVIG